MDGTREHNPEDGTTGAERNAGAANPPAARQVGQGLDQGVQALTEFQAALAQRTRECVDTTDMYVRANPWQAVGIAAGVGLLLGLLMSRR